MDIIYIELFGFSLYVALFAIIWRKLTQHAQLSVIDLCGLAIALVLHGYISYINIDGGDGQDLGAFKVFTMTTWIAMLLVYWNILKHRAFGLLLITMPIAALSLLEVAFFKNVGPIPMQGQGLNVWHVLLGIVALSVLILAALQSILVLYIDKGLKHHPATIHAWLGPLQSMERFLMQLLTSGFTIMSIALGLAFLLPENIIATQGLHKLVLTGLSWMTLATLLIGHYWRGWRGVFAAKWTLLGVFLLVLGYFGSKFVLEFIISHPL